MNCHFADTLGQAWTCATVSPPPTVALTVTRVVTVHEGVSLFGASLISVIFLAAVMAAMVMGRASR